MGIFSFFRPKTFRKKFLSAMDEAKIVNEWERIEELLAAGKPSALREAVLRSDKLLDYALLKTSFGKTMGERLKDAKDHFSREVYEKVWDAHKTRNALTHEMGFEPHHFTAKEAVENFKEGLRELGARHL